jgi:hypothetical protein
LLAITFVGVDAATNFGHSLRSRFMLEDGYINFNHGSYGSAPREVIAAQQKFVEIMESRPDPWFRGGYQAILQTVRSQLARCIGVFFPIS